MMIKHNFYTNFYTQSCLISALAIMTLTSCNSGSSTFRETKTSAASVTNYNASSQIARTDIKWNIQPGYHNGPKVLVDISFKAPEFQEEQLIQKFKVVLLDENGANIKISNEYPIPTINNGRIKFTTASFNNGHFLEIGKFSALKILVITKNRSMIEIFNENAPHILYSLQWWSKGSGRSDEELLNKERISLPNNYKNAGGWSGIPLAINKNLIGSSFTNVLANPDGSVEIFGYILQSSNLNILKWNSDGQAFEITGKTGTAKLIIRRADNKEILKVLIVSVYDKAFIFTSDPQFPCVINCGQSSKEVSEQNIISQYNWINTVFPTATAMVVNGDLTEFSHKDEVAKSNELFNILRIPYYIGLGNHDYVNNKDNCYQNACAIRGIMRLINFVNNKKYEGDKINADFQYAEYYSFPAIAREITGSLGYAVEKGDFYIIQINDNPEDSYAKPSGYMVQSPAPPKHLNYEINQYIWGVLDTALDFKWFKIKLNSSELWLEQQLEYAAQNNKIIIFNKHEPETKQSILDLLDKYKVKLRFAGHLHDMLGMQINSFYLSGSSAKGDLLTLETQNNSSGKDKVFILSSENVISGKYANVATIFQPPHPSFYHKDFPPSRPFYIKVKNKGAYVSRVSVRYQQNGEEYNDSNNNLAVGNVYSKLMPPGATNVRLQVEYNAVIFWRDIFSTQIDSASNSCFHTWGTVFSTPWSVIDCNNF